MEGPQHQKTETQLLLTSNQSSGRDLGLDIGNRNNLGSEKTGPSSERLSGPLEITTDLGSSFPSYPDPARLSISSLRSNGRGHTDDPAHPPEPDPRFSESSRSDWSAAERGLYLGSPKNCAARSAKGFRLPRLKRHRAPLFPPPVKAPPGAAHSPSASGRQSPSSGPSGAGRSKGSVEQNHPDQGQSSHIPTSSHSAVGSSSQTGLSAPPLLRKNSAASACSMNSLTQGRRRQGGRRRSSTLGSVAGIPGDQQQPSPSLAPFGRTSTSTNGRKSFGDIFSRPHRVKYTSELPARKNGVQSGGPPGTPVSGSKTGSWSHSRDTVSYPEREESDTPATYLSRLGEAAHRGVIASILSKSNEDFYKTALRKFMRSFSFFGDPIDMAIRKLLMEVELPKETQQIDRVLQGFADRYHECNPGIFSTPGMYFSVRATGLR
jgi:Sec7 domain